jgi:hypothetical protein
MPTLNEVPEVAEHAGCVRQGRSLLQDSSLNRVSA